MVDVIFNYDLLVEEIERKYEGSSLAIKITKFCKDVKIKLYRFRRIVEENKGYFQTDEVYRMKRVLKINDTDYYFLNRKEA